MIKIGMLLPYEDMLLIEGENKISISDPAKFTLTIQPNWRCI